MTDDRGGQRIREAFERSLEPASDGFLSRMRNAVTAPPAKRAARRWPIEVAAAVLAIVAVATLTLAHLPVRAPAPVAQSGVVPWADLPAPNVAQPFTKPGVRACFASQLVFDVHVADPSYVGAGPANTSFWNISVINSSSAECFVGPTMDVTFETAQGPLKVSPQPWPGDLVYLHYMDQAVGEIDSFPCALPRITRLTISPGPGLGSTSLDPGPAGGFGAPCPDRAQTYMVELTSGGHQGGYAALTETSMTAPGIAHPGERVRFLVTITNRPAPRFGIGPGPSPVPVVFTPCPTYHLELEGIESTFHTYQLNCAAAITIDNFQSETFEMFVDVPADAKPGPAVLVWSIDGSPQRWQRTSAYVAIET
jgi:hypothetical protein